MKYAVAEIFTSVQGEGVWTGTPMTFIRFVGCSVGKKICQHCDTDFATTYEWKGGGHFSPEELLARVRAPHVCLTGGEPFDQDLLPLLDTLRGRSIHIETSGTIDPSWLTRKPMSSLRTVGNAPLWLWITCSPKPGFLDSMLLKADELKIIVPGLGNGEGWPTIDTALRYAQIVPVFLQPRNGKHDVDRGMLDLVMQTVLDNPDLRLSAQLHKFLTVR